MILRRLVMGILRVLGFSFLAALGCSSSVPAAASRVIDTNATALSGTPVCFAPAPENWSLSGKAEYQKSVQQCESAAARRNVRVESFASGGCLVATLDWGANDSGKRLGECDAAGTCESQVIVAKSLRISLAEPGKRTIAESNASISSTFTGFSEKSYFALCSAAFHEYPKPLTRTELDVDTE